MRIVVPPGEVSSNAAGPSHWTAIGGWVVRKRGAPGRGDLEGGVAEPLDADRGVGGGRTAELGGGRRGGGRGEEQRGGGAIRNGKRRRGTSDHWCSVLNGETGRFDRGALRKIPARTAVSSPSGCRQCTGGDWLTGGASPSIHRALTG